jgi:HK97 family phage major capsid protein
MNTAELWTAYNAAVDNVEKFSKKWDALTANPAAASPSVVESVKKSLEDALDDADRLKDEYEKSANLDKALETHSASRIRVAEPDMYGKGGRSFLTDLFAAQIGKDPTAAERIAKHHAFEAEKFAVSTSTVGGVIPPQYLVGLYAKASRNGRVYADQVNGQPLPAEGVSLIVPRLTGGAAADVQSSESSTVATQDPTETDLTVPVCTIAGYLPVSRQTLERGAYSETLLFEDLVARYWAKLDVQAINGQGSGGQLRGALQTSSIKTSSTGTATVAAVWPKIADVIQQINTDLGGLGYVADKIFMHPRRWGFFEAALDSQNRPLLGIEGLAAFNAAGEGVASGYGLVGRMHGLPVYTDANIPTTLGTGTNEDRIIVQASQVVHLWEADGGHPITLRFEETAGTSLQTQLVAYGYAAFTAGRYPSAVGVVSGAGLVPPSF